jgi:hypothetical protein
MHGSLFISTETVNSQLIILAAGCKTPQSKDYDVLTSLKDFSSYGSGTRNEACEHCDVSTKFCSVTRACAE